MFLIVMPVESVQRRQRLILQFHVDDLFDSSDVIAIATEDAPTTVSTSLFLPSALR